MLGLSALFLFYLFCCWRFWSVARHYNIKFHFLSFSDLLFAWDHLRFSDKCLYYRIGIITIVLVCVGLMIWSPL